MNQAPALLELQRGSRSIPSSLGPNALPRCFRLIVPLAFACIDARLCESCKKFEIHAACNTSRVPADRNDSCLAFHESFGARRGHSLAGMLLGLVCFLATEASQVREDLMAPFDLASTAITKCRLLLVGRDAHLVLGVRAGRDLVLLCHHNSL